MKRKRTSAPTWKSAAARRVQHLAGAGVSVEASVPIVVSKLLSSVRCPPTELEALCALLGVTSVDESDSISVAGELRRDSHGYQIYCASGQAETRRRFTIAHELAHLVFERSGPGCPRTGNELERLCEMIAAELLMPTEVFKRELALVHPNAAGILELATKFRVSLSAAAIRVAEFQSVTVLGVENGQVVWARGPLRPDAMQSAFDTLMRQAFEDESADRLVFINSQDCRGFFEADWIHTSGERSALFILNRISYEAAKVAMERRFAPQI